MTSFSTLIDRRGPVLAYVNASAARRPSRPAGLQVRVSRVMTQPRRAARGALISGAALALSCLLLACTSGTGGPLAIVGILLAAFCHLAAELLFVASSWGLSVPLMPPDAPSEYQGAFATGESLALMLAPALMTTLVADWGQPGWVVLALIFLIPAALVTPATEWALRTRQRSPSARGCFAWDRE